jgi:hypothetical protein
MNRSGLWHRVVAFALILLMVFLAAAISAPAVEADDPYYTYGSATICSDFTPRLYAGGEAESFNLTIGINWGDATPRAVNTGMNVSFICPTDGDLYLTVDFNPSTFLLAINQTQNVEVTVSAKEGAENNNYIEEIYAIDLDWNAISSFSAVPENRCRINPWVLNGDDACFIATAAYGTSTATEIDTLRAFRDEVLLESTLGSKLVEWYYQASPPLADFISENQPLRTLVRDLFVEPIIWAIDAVGILWRD